MTKFKAGGLRIDDQPILAGKRFTAPTKTPLPWFEGRCYCLPTSPQGATSSCAGQATAGWIEADTWARTQVAKQVDGFAIYAKAKEIDGDGRDGTSLTSAVKAAKQLGLMRKNLSTRTIRTKRQVQYALHRHRTVIAGFMIEENWNRCSKDGVIPAKASEAIGGHAVLLCWYNEDPDHFQGIGFQNSWKGWGANGFGRMDWDSFNRQFLYAIAFE